MAHSRSERLQDRARNPHSRRERSPASDLCQQLPRLLELTVIRRQGGLEHVDGAARQILGLLLPALGAREAGQTVEDGSLPAGRGVVVLDQDTHPLEEVAGIVQTPSLERDPALLGQADGVVPLGAGGGLDEAFLRLIDQRGVSWQDRGQFFAVAARVMRRILVDHARARVAEKRGGKVHLVELEQLGEVAFGERPGDLLVLDECLEDLKRLDADRARLVELRFFAGLSLEQTAEALDLSRATVVRQRRLTKGWLLRQLQTR